MLIIPCIVNQFQKKFQQDDTLVQYFIISCKLLYIFHPKHVERLAGNNRILYKSVILLEHFLELIHDARNDEHKISKTIRPPRSPDLSPPDFCVWSAIKNSVYSNNPHTIDELKMAITEHIRNVDRAVLNTVFQNTVRRVNKCLETDRGTLWTLLVTFRIVTCI
jgi:transposase